MAKKPLRERIRLRVAALGTSQNQLGLESGHTKAWISRTLREYEGERVTMRTLALVAESLQVDLKWMLDDSSDPFVGTEYKQR